MNHKILNNASVRKYDKHRYNLGSLIASQGLFIYGNENNGGGGESGFSVKYAGDVNGDGFKDVIIGAPNDGSKYLYGATYSYNGGVSNAGDVNGDGDAECEASYERGKFSYYY